MYTPSAPCDNKRGRGTLAPTRCHTVIKLPSPPPAGNPYNKLFDYYAAQDIFPTYSGFESADGLRRHEYLRRRAFADKLKLPARSFRGARLIEFGPDTGENALVFAQWGAACTLVEPNIKAHAKVREYFARFGLSGGLETIIEADISQFAGRPEAAQQYDLVIAEGFIYTVKPESVWINLFHDLLVDDGGDATLLVHLGQKAEKDPSVISKPASEEETSLFKAIKAKLAKSPGWYSRVAKDIRGEIGRAHV